MNHDRPGRNAASRVLVGLSHFGVIVATAAALTAVPLVASANAPTPTVEKVRLIAVPGNHTDQAPYDVVFSTSAPLKQTRDDENVLKYPGGVGVETGAGARIYHVTSGRRGNGRRSCYAGEGAYRFHRGRLQIGHKYLVTVAVTNDKNAARTKQHLALRQQTVKAAARALGC